MLPQIEDIAREYITQSSHYKNGRVGNPFTAVRNKKFVVGIVDGKHDPAALIGLHTQLRWRTAPLFYFKYFLARLPYKPMKYIHERMRTNRVKRATRINKKHIRKCAIWMMDRFPERYGNIYFDNFLFLSFTFFNEKILNISNSGIRNMFDIVTNYDPDITGRLDKILRSHIKNRTTKPRPEYVRLDSYYKDGFFNDTFYSSKNDNICMAFRDVIDYGSLVDLDMFLSVLKKERNRSIYAEYLYLNYGQN